MAKSIRSKREKRLRAIRRELVQPLYDQKEAAKLAALEAALNAPKLPVKPYTSSSSSSASAMDVNTSSFNTASEANAKPDRDMDVEMADDTHTKNFLRPVGKKLKKKFKLARNKRRGKGHIKKRHI